MSIEIITESELREKLKGEGKKKREIDELIEEYINISSIVSIDKDAISNILEKTKEESVLRVGTFNLTQEQYDALLNYFEDTNIPLPKKDANTLVKKAINELISIIS